MISIYLYHEKFLPSFFQKVFLSNVVLSQDGKKLKCFYSCDICLIFTMKSFCQAFFKKRLFLTLLLTLTCTHYTTDLQNLCGIANLSCNLLYHEAKMFACKDIFAKPSMVQPRKARRGNVPKSLRSNDFCTHYNMKSSKNQLDFPAFMAVLVLFCSMCCRAQIRSPRSDKYYLFPAGHDIA